MKAESLAIIVLLLHVQLICPTIQLPSSVSAAAPVSSCRALPCIAGYYRGLAVHRRLILRLELCGGAENEAEVNAPTRYQHTADSHAPTKQNRTDRAPSEGAMADHDRRGDDSGCSPLPSKRRVRSPQPPRRRKGRRGGAWASADAGAGEEVRVASAGGGGGRAREGGWLKEEVAEEEGGEEDGGSAWSESVSLNETEVLLEAKREAEDFQVRPHAERKRE